MVQKKVITYTDDVTGEEAEDITTHTILIDGAGVEIDLSGASHDRLLEILHPYLSAAGARRVRGGIAAAGSRGKRRGAATAEQRGHRADSRLGQGERLRGQRPRPSLGRGEGSLRKGEFLTPGP